MVSAEGWGLIAGVVCPKCGRRVGAVDPEHEWDAETQAALVLMAHECAS